MNSPRAPQMILGAAAVLVAFASPATAKADCTGSGVDWACAAGSSRAQVQAAIDAADDEAVIKFAAGTYNWSGGIISLNSVDGVTLICEMPGSCAVTHDGDLIYKDDVPTNSNRLHRISGFSFTGTSGTGTIWFLGRNDLTSIRIDHNTFHETSASDCKTAVMFGAIDPDIDGNMFGVVDHNTFMSSGKNHTGVKNLAGQDAAWQPGLPGTKNNLYIEDNKFNYPTSGYDGGCGCIDAWAGGPTVFRFNDATNCRAVTHGVCHGGPPNYEVYRNKISTPDGYRHIHHQGSGEMFAFDNDLTNGEEIALLHYRSCPSQDTGCGMPRCDGSQAIDGNRTPADVHMGYPCFRQPGRDSTGRLRPIFAWRNVNDGGASELDFQNAWGCSNPAPEDHVKPERDYYNAVSANAQTSATSPFDGTTGMGFGTLANRPATCTTNADPLDAGNGGVGYWATDVGAWNLLAGAGSEQGVLYMCTAKDTWTEYYQPFSYPHPLVFDGNCVNGMLDAGETCDPPSTCPAECPDDGNSCTSESLAGTALLCDVVCNHMPITACASGDGCCPAGCSGATDGDCVAQTSTGSTTGAGAGDAGGGGAGSSGGQGCGCRVAGSPERVSYALALVLACLVMRRRSAAS